MHFHYILYRCGLLVVVYRQILLPIRVELVEIHRLLLRLPRRAKLRRDRRTSISAGIDNSTLQVNAQPKLAERRISVVPSPSSCPPLSSQRSLIAKKSDGRSNSLSNLSQSPSLFSTAPAFEFTFIFIVAVDPSNSRIFLLVVVLVILLVVPLFASSHNFSLTAFHLLESNSKLDPPFCYVIEPINLIVVAVIVALYCCLSLSVESWSFISAVQHI